MLRAALFDMGGTLLDFAGAGETWFDVERRAIQNAHRLVEERHAEAAWDPFFERVKRISDDYWRRATAGEISFVVDHFFRDTCREMALDCPEELVRDCVDAFCSVVADACYPFEDSVPTLEAMRELGLKIGLISNTAIHGRVHREDLARFGLIDYFESMVFSGDVGLWKPDPRIFRLVLEDLGVAPEDAFFVGDRVIDDVGGARAVGMRTILKVNERTDNDYADPRAATIEPDERIRRIGEIVPLARRWRERE